VGGDSPQWMTTSYLTTTLSDEGPFKSALTPVNQAEIPRFQCLSEQRQAPLRTSTHGKDHHLGVRAVFDPRGGIWGGLSRATHGELHSRIVSPWGWNTRQGGMVLQGSGVVVAVCAANVRALEG